MLVVLAACSKSPELALTEQLQHGLNENRQKVFDCFHPVGTATRVEVHEVNITWKNDKPSKNLNDMAGFAVRFTLYWRGPITTDGFTKIVAVFDNESKRYVQSEILATNGTTNSQVSDAAGQFLGGFLEGLINNEQ